MPRRLRRDSPGRLHHVMSRGIARRPIFESRRDVRYLLACLAKQVRAGDLELLAYSVMQTHFHLFVRSPRGRLSAAMQRALDAYSRWFNRSRRRDGPLFRARFVNRIVESHSYAHAVLRYIDFNPVSAGLASSPFEYPFGSARHYASGRAPRWLARRAVADLLGRGPTEPWDPDEYARVIGCEPGAGERWLVGRRLRDSTLRAGDPLDELLGAPLERVRSWMLRKARLADGTTAGWPVASAASIQSAVAAAPGTDLSGEVMVGRASAPRREVVEAALLRLCAGLRQQEVADRMGLVLATAQRRVRLFVRAARTSPELVRVASDVLVAALRRDFPRTQSVRGLSSTILPRQVE